MDVKEKVSYLKGLVDGMKMDASKSDETRLLLAIVDTLDTVAQEIEELQVENGELCEYIDSVSDDLEELQEEMELMDCCDCDGDWDCDCDEDCDCGCCSDDLSEEEQ